MGYIQDELRKLREKLPTYTAEQLEAAEAARRRNYQSHNICRADCPICQGGGYIRGDDGHLHPCPNVDPYDLYPLNRLGLTESERAGGWYNLKDVNEATMQAAEAVRRMMDIGGGWVYLWGDYGVGKTLILKTAVAMALREWKLAAYTRMVDILDHVRAGFNEKDPSEQAQARLEWYSRLPVLAIDEFDRVNATPWVSERRFNLMDTRYTQGIRGETVTLLASNADPATLEGYLFDRAQDNRFIIRRVTGESYRLGAQRGNQ